MKNKTFLRFFVLVLTVLMLLPVTVAATKYPKHENYVADDADILSESVINMIRDTNKKLNADYLLTIAVCTVNTVGDVNIGTYAQELYKEWKLGEGVLILIAKDDKNYFFVPSVGIEDIVTNEDFTSVRDNYFEVDFNNGAYENAVQKAVTKLKNLMSAGMQERAAEEKKAQDEAEANQTEEEKAEGTVIGSIIVGFFKFLLFLAVLAAVLVAALFIGAIFNDDLLVIFRKYILRKNDNVRPISSPDFYDERLYGKRTNPNRRPDAQNRSQGQLQPQRRPNAPHGYIADGRQYPQNYNPNAGYSYNGQPRVSQNPQNGQYPRNMGGQGYPQNRPMNNQNYNNPNYNNANPVRPNNGNSNYNNHYNPNINNNRTGYNNAPNNAVSNAATMQFNIPRRN